MQNESTFATTTGAQGQLEDCSRFKREYWPVCFGNNMTNWPGDSLELQNVLYEVEGQGPNMTEGR